MSDFRSSAPAPLSSHTTGRPDGLGTSFGSPTKTAGRRFVSQPLRISKRYESLAPSRWILNQTVLASHSASFGASEGSRVERRCSSLMGSKSLRCRVRTWITHCLYERTRKLPTEQGERCDYDNAEEVGFEPTDPCRSHDFQSCRFGRSRTPPTSLRRLSLHLLALSCAVAGFCATDDRESSQSRKAAALSGFACVPQGTWLLRTAAPDVQSRRKNVVRQFPLVRRPPFTTSVRPAVGHVAKS